MSKKIDMNLEAVDVVKTDKGYDIVYIKYDKENQVASIDRIEFLADNVAVAGNKISQYFSYKLSGLLDRIKKPL